MKNEKYLTVKEIAEHFDVSVPAVYKWLKKGLPYKMEKVIGLRPRKVTTIETVNEFLGLGITAAE